MCISLKLYYILLYSIYLYFIIFYTMQVVLDCELVYILLIKPTGSYLNHMNLCLTYP